MGRSGFQHCQTTNGIFVLAETAWSGSSWVAQVPGLVGDRHLVVVERKG